MKKELTDIIDKLWEVSSNLNGLGVYKQMSPLLTKLADIALRLEGPSNGRNSSN